MLGFAMPIFFVQVYFLNFSTDVLLLDAGVVGGLFALGRLWDAISDPVVGYLSDRTETRIGRRRPWMLAGIPLLLAFFGMLFLPPVSLSGWPLIAWVGVALFGVYTAYTIYTIPHLSLGAELTLDHHERTRVFAVRHVAFTLGIMLVFPAVQMVQNAGDPRAAAWTLFLVLAPISALLLAIAPARLRERTEHQGRGSHDARAAARDVLRNPHARVLLGVIFIEQLGAAVLAVLAPYLTKYVLLEPGAVAYLPTFYVLASVGSVAFWVKLSRTHGKKLMWLLAMVGTSLSFGATIFAGPGDVVLVAVLLTCAGIAAGCGGAMSQSILADVMDFDEVQSGERKEGAYSAAAGFAFKAASGCTVALTGFALSLSGFEPNVDQGPAALWTIKLIFGGAPFVMYLIGALIFRRFSLDAQEHARIRAILDERKQGVGS